MSEQGRPRFYLTLIVWSVLAMLIAVSASGVAMALINERKLSFAVAFALAMAFERGPDLLVVGWLTVLAATWNWRHLGRWQWPILASIVATTIAVTGMLAVARLSEKGLAGWWQAGAPIQIPAFFLVVGATVGAAYATIVAGCFSRAQSKTAAPVRAAVRDHDRREA